jgi:hypothetical protein
MFLDMGNFVGDMGIYSGEHIFRNMCVHDIG